METDYFGNSYGGTISNVNASFQGSRVETFNNYVATESKVDKLKACIAALRQPDPRDIRLRLQLCTPTPTKGTCEWILEDSVFQSWKSEDDPAVAPRLIWIGNEENMGKTTLALFISEHLEKTYATDDDPWVLSYFCDRREEHLNTAASIMKGFMYQLYKKQQDVATVLYDEWILQQDALFDSHSIHAQWRVFRAMVNKSATKRIYCVIDGVDQYHSKGHERELDHFMKMLNDYFTRDNKRQASRISQSGGSSSLAKVPELRAMIFTRENPDCVLAELRPFPRLAQRRDHGKAGQSDLQRHIDATVEEVSIKCSGNNEPTTQVTETVTNALNAGDSPNFVWVTLVAEQMMMMTQSQIKKYAKRLPKTVEELHMQTLLNVPSRRRAALAAMLKWVALAVRPLTLLELTKAVKYSIAASFSRRTLEKLLALSSGLVSVREGRVALSTSSVLGLLTAEQSPLLQNKKLKMFVFDSVAAHSQLTNACIAYLQGSANLKKSRKVRIKPNDKLSSADAAFLQKHPFLEYAVVHWPAHARQGSIEDTDYARPFFQDDTGRRRLWWESYWISLRQSFAWRWTAPGGFSLLHMAAFFDIVPLALYVEGTDHLRKLLGSEDHQGMKPINWATERSQAAMVRFLLQRGESDDEALRAAARTGEASIMRMLLENRSKMLRSPMETSPRSWPATPSSPFQFLRKATLASVSDWSKKLDQSNEEPATTLSPDMKGYGKMTSETPLHIAASCGHEDVIAALLDAGEIVDAATEGGWTPLHNAAWFGRVPAAKRLLTAKADANAQTNEQLTPLHCAVKNGQADVVECLLGGHSVNMEAEDKFGVTPFHMACKLDNILIMEILLDYGANIEKKMRQGWTPLIWACIHGKIKVAEALLRRGADVHAKWIHMVTETGRSIGLGPLTVAKKYLDQRQEGSERLTRLLEKFGATEVNSTADTEQLKLPAVLIEEVYSVPQVPDVRSVELDGTNDDHAPDVDDAGSASESDDDSDDDSVGSQDESHSRKQSTISMQNMAVASRPSEVALLGLGIDEALTGASEDVIVAVPERPTAELIKRKPVLMAEHVAAAGADAAPVVPVTLRRADTDSHIESVSHDRQASATNQDGTPEELKGLASIEGKRSNSVPTLVASMGERFRRFVPVKHPGLTSDDTTNGSPERDQAGPLDRCHAVGGADEEAASAPSPEDTGVLRRFGTRRAFSWKSEIVDDSDKVIPDASEGQEPNAKNTNPDESDTFGCSPDVSRFGRFGSRRTFSWKTEGSGDRKTSIPTSPAIQESDEIPSIPASATEPLCRETDSGNTNDVAPAVADEARSEAAKQTRFSGRRLFGKRTKSGENGG